MRSPVPALRRSLFAAALLAGLWACGGAGDVERARGHLERYRLELALALLEGQDSPAAETLLREVEERRAARAERLEELERLIEQGAPVEARDLLREAARAEPDPAVRERAARLLSALADRLAEQRMEELARARPAAPPPAAGPGEAEPRSGGGSGAVVEREPPETLAAALADARAALAAGQWARGMATLDLAVAGSGELAPEFHGLRTELLEGAVADAEELLAKAARLEQERGPHAAQRTLEREAERFPAHPRLAHLARARSQLAGRAAAARAGPARGAARGSELARGSPAPAPAPGGTPDPAALLERARALELEGRLDAARAAWIDAALAAGPGPGRAAHMARARSLERRLALWTELAAAAAAEPARFLEAGISDADEEGFLSEGRRQSWNVLDAAELRRLAARAPLSLDARVGLLLERLARGDAAGQGGALAELARLARRGEIEEPEAFAIVAESRGEEVPPGGYVFHEGSWLARAAYEDAALRARAGELVARLERARGDARDGLLGDLHALGEAARPALATSLETRFARAIEVLGRGNTLAALERLAERRRELDRRRETALALIFDEERYFYPYSGGGLPPGKRESDYWPVQREVDALVVRVQEVWTEQRGVVRLPGAFQEALDELRWTLEAAGDVALSLELPSGLPSWIHGLPALPEVDLESFAWDAIERGERAYDRAVLAHNRRLWDEWAKRGDLRSPREEERRQVSITNSYRLLMGRRALAWNPDVQLAARWHSEYMADTGDFGHYQPDPERRTPFDRMRLAGYDHGASENCHRGSGSAEGAHMGWRRSSGHHRNILMPGHREMASALASGYWTQNFGRGTSFLDELEGWHD